MRELVTGHKTVALALAGFEASGEEMELAKFLTEVYWVRRDQANYKTVALALHYGKMLTARTQYENAPVEEAIAVLVGFQEQVQGNLT